MERDELIGRILSYDSWDEINDCGILYIDVTMKRDFGPLKAGHKFNSLSFDFETGVCVQYTTEGEEQEKFRFYITDKEPV